MKHKLRASSRSMRLPYSRAADRIHQFLESERKELPPVPQVMVRTIPENGRRSLYIASHIGRVLGMPAEDSRELVDRAYRSRDPAPIRLHHRWRLDDLVMWDDRCTMHRGTDFDDLRYTRDMHRATVSDIANTCEQEGVAIPHASLKFLRDEFAIQSAVLPQACENRAGSICPARPSLKNSWTWRLSKASGSSRFTA